MDNIFKRFEDEAKNNKDLNQYKEKFKDKSDDEVLREAMKIGKQLKDQFGEEEFQNKLKELKKIEPFLNREQKEKLRKIIDSVK